MSGSLLLEEPESPGQLWYVTKHHISKENLRVFFLFFIFILQEIGKILQVGLKYSAEVSSLILSPKLCQSHCFGESQARGTGLCEGNRG